MIDLETTTRALECLLALAFIQAGLEHIRAAIGARERWLFVARIGLSVLLLLGVAVPWVLGLHLILALMILDRFQGPYNGGSDRMALLILTCVAAARIFPAYAELAIGYLAMQLILSYVISGAVKIANPDWRTGRALRDVFAFSAYPVSDALRGWADWPRVLWVMSWAVMLFEILFPLALTSQLGLALALGLAAGFHLANACLFGLNRFFWIWIAAYPSIWWFQGRIFGAGVM